MGQAAGMAGIGSDGAEGMGMQVEAAVARVGYAPIVRVDAARREVELCATSEAVDSFGTVFDYEASKDAFTRWIGNVREMHERRAVGRRVGVRCDDETRRIFVTIRVSRGARDTWEKVLDGTLRGASIGASNVVWRRQRRAVTGGERELDVATRYDLAELSLVDNPSNPDALGITFVRDAAPDLALLDRLGEEMDFTAEDAKDAEGERREEEIGYRQLPLSFVEMRGAEGRDAGVVARPDLARREVTDDGRLMPREGVAAGERLHAAARAVLVGCGCAVCGAAVAALGAGEAGAERMADGDTSGLREGALVRALGAALRLSAGRLERLDDGLCEMRVLFEAGVERLAERMEGAGRDAAEVASDLRRRVERLEAQPMPGGPAARVVEKAHALAAGGERASAEEQYRALEGLAGRLRDPQAQMAVAAELIRLQREEMGNQRI